MIPKDDAPIKNVLVQFRYGHNLHLTLLEVLSLCKACLHDLFLIVGNWEELDHEQQIMSKMSLSVDPAKVKFFNFPDYDDPNVKDDMVGSLWIYYMHIWNTL